MLAGYIEPRGWDAQDVLWVIAQLARHYDLEPGAVMQACIGERPGRTPSSEAYISTQTRREARDVEGMLLKYDDTTITAYLRRWDVPKLAYVIPAETRRYLIRCWVAKLQEHWSAELCHDALIPL